MICSAAAPIDGIYTFTVGARLWGDSLDSESMQLWFNYNGQRMQTFGGPIKTNSSAFVGSVTTRIEKGDFIDFRMWHYGLVQREIAEKFHHTFVRWALVQAL